MLQAVEKLPDHRLSQGWSQPPSVVRRPPLSTRYKDIYRVSGRHVHALVIIFRTLDLCFEYYAQIRRNRGRDRRYHQKTAKDRSLGRIPEVAHRRRGRGIRPIPLRAAVSSLGRNHAAVRRKAVVARGRGIV